MKYPSLLALACCVAFTIGCTSDESKSKTPSPPATPLAQAEPAIPEVAPDPDAWPRTIKQDGTNFVIHQPQLDSWDGNALAGRAAVSVQPDGAKELTYGVIYLEGATTVDREERMVHFDKILVTKTNFPSVPAPLAYLDEFQGLIPREVKDLSLDRLEASLAILNAGEKARRETALRNDPPVIIFAAKPTMLVHVEGAPQWVPVGETGLQRVVNTRVLLLRDVIGRCYLHLYDGYVTAATLDGPWAIAQDVPPAVRDAEAIMVAAKQVDLLAGQANPETNATPTLAATGMPDIRVATQPTELILTEGEPKWIPIPGTQLLFVENTPAHVFKDLVDQQNYLLLSGRWFKASGESGPWTHVAGKALPKDFAAIPDESPKENVKAAVPGTRQAQEAVIADSITTTTKIDRKTAKLEPVPTYDGGPQLMAIDKTPLFYVANSATPVIKVDETTWYACQNGVWFVAASVDGPWAVATTVPAVIYSIPPSSPVYYVTYVRVYRFDDQYVWTGYTPGYYGTVVSSDGTVVYGTGYIYDPYVSTTVYVSYGSTYGYGASVCWSPWAGWGYGFAVGWCWGASWGYWGCCPPAPYWGPYWGACYGWGYNAYGGITAWGPYGWAGTSGNIYSQNGPWSSVSRVQGGFNAWTGNRWASQYGRAYNSSTGTRAVGARGAVANVYTGGYAFGGRAGAVNENTGNAAWGSKVTAGNVVTGSEVTARRGGVYNDATGETTRYGSVHGDQGTLARVGDDVYAGHDGNVYKRGDDGSWNQVARPKAETGVSGSVSAGTHDLSRDLSGATPYNSGNFDRSSLDREYSARQTGAARTQSFNSSYGGYGGGGMRGGGGGRRR
jgi:hypothetical protein